MGVTKFGRQLDGPLVIRGGGKRDVSVNHWPESTKRESTSSGSQLLLAGIREKKKKYRVLKHTMGK